MGIGEFKIINKKPYKIQINSNKEILEIMIIMILKIILVINQLKMKMRD
jgi:hypothetical protein